MASKRTVSTHTSLGFIYSRVLGLTGDTALGFCGDPLHHDAHSAPASERVALGACRVGIEDEIVVGAVRAAEGEVVARAAARVISRASRERGLKCHKSGSARGFARDHRAVAAALLLWQSLVLGACGRRRRRWRRRRWRRGRGCGRGGGAARRRWHRGWSGRAEGPARAWAGAVDDALRRRRPGAPVRAVEHHDVAREGASLPLEVWRGGVVAPVVPCVRAAGGGGGGHLSVSNPSSPNGMAAGVLSPCGGGGSAAERLAAAGPLGRS
jgi:hypothetical protein